MKKVQVLVGADPEAFLVNQHGRFISAVGLIGGTKWAPRDMGDGFAIQEDNVAVEYNIPPCASSEEFVRSINLGLDHLRNAVRDYGLNLRFIPSAEFDEEQLATPQARQFGCEPDWNAWSQKINRKPNATNKALRSSGGHVHIQSSADPWILGQYCDLQMGVASVLFDDDTRRRLLYGKAGAIRVKNYPGIEYRTLSNRWLESDVRKDWVFRQALRAVEKAETGVKIGRTLGRMICKAINTGDRALAQQLVEREGLEVPA